MTSGTGEGPGPVQLAGRPTVSGRWRAAVVVGFMALAGWLVVGGGDRGWFPVLTVGGCSWGYLLPTSQASAQGVRRPWPRRRRWISWDEVEAVEAEPFEGETVLALVDGSRVPSGFRVHLAPELAALGDRPLRKSMPPTMAALPVPPARIEEEKALRARAAALGAENARMTAELARLRRHQTP